MNKIKENIIRYENLYNILVILSVATFNLAVTTIYRNSYFNILMQVILVIIILAYLLFSKHLLLNIVKMGNKSKLKDNIYYLLTIFLSFESSKIIVTNMSKGYVDRGSILINVAKKVASVLHTSVGRLLCLEKIACFFIMMPFLIMIWLVVLNYVIPTIRKFIKSLSKKELRFILISGLVSIIIIFGINLLTNAFAYPIQKNGHKFVKWDVLYTSDNGEQILSDSFTNFSAGENDLRQPLFAVFSFPFGLIAKIGVSLFSFLPENIVYPFFISILQAFCLIICSVLLVRLVGRKDSIFDLLFYSLMFVSLFFALNIEQYVFGIFWLIILVYYLVMKNKSNEFLFCATTGSLMTNGILLPFLLPRKDIKTFFKTGIKYVLVFILLLLLSGRLSSVIWGLSNFTDYTRFMGTELSFIDRLLQYINFIASCFIAPLSYVDPHFSYPPINAYRLCSVNTVNMLGLVLLIFMVISFLLNMKKRIARISFGWLLFSFFILAMVGWGTAENGLIIYGIYFSWAYFILIDLLINMVLYKLPKFKNIIWCLIILSMFVINGHGILDIVKFGIHNYPFTLNV